MKKLILLSTLLIASCEDHHQQPCIDPHKQASNIGILCIATYDPVCGCDGKTYSNLYWADKAGVSSYKKGACPN